MSFRTSAAGVSRSFELVRRSFTQHDGLVFSEVLTAEHIDQAFATEEVSFGETDPKAVYSRAITLWAVVSQGMFTGLERSCRAAVMRVAVYFALQGWQISTNTGAYCRARAKIGEAVLRRLAQGVAERAEAVVPATWKWRGRTVRMVDGTTFSMPDTEANQEEYPQSRVQAPGLGFPLLRTVALVSLATGMVSAMATAPWAGKGTGETSLLRTLFSSLKPGEVIVADRYFCGWFALAVLQQLGVDFVIRMNHRRHYDFRRGKRVGHKDHVVSWPRPQRPDWMDEETYATMPSELTVRETFVPVSVRGFRVTSLIAVSSFLDADAVNASEIASLYRSRWRVELHLREIKSSMELSVLRGLTPAMVRQELWAGILAYNLIRHSMLQSALVCGKQPRELSFAATSQILTATWCLAALPPDVKICTAALAVLRINSGSLHVVGNRPDRIEPRAIKRRETSHDLLSVPRREAIAKLLNGPSV